MMIIDKYLHEDYNDWQPNMILRCGRKMRKSIWRYKNILLYLYNKMTSKKCWSEKSWLKLFFCSQTFSMTFLCKKPGRNYSAILIVLPFFSVCGHSLIYISMITKYFLTMIIYISANNINFGDNFSSPQTAR